MIDDSLPTPRTAHSGERPGASLLIRCWLEPRESSDEAPTLRGYVKNLKTGEEQFIKNLDAVGQQILRSLDAARELVAEGPAEAHEAHGTRR